MPEALHATNEDIFIIYGFGREDGNILFIQLNEQGTIRWTRHKSVASEFTRDEARKIMADAEQKGLRTYTTKVA